MVDRIVVPPSFMAMRGPARGWLAAPPELVEAQCRRWDLTIDGPVTHGSNALVVPVVRAGVLLALRRFPRVRAPPGEVAACGSGTVGAPFNWLT